MSAKTLFDKIWESHVVLERDDGWSLLYVDTVFLHEGSWHAFPQLEERGLPVRNPGRCIGCADHLVPTVGLVRSTSELKSEKARKMATAQEDYTQKNGIRLFGVGDARQGIVHVVGPELGLSQPGTTIICGDSHTSTHGAIGAFAFGVGNSELAHGMATQTLWRKKPKQLLLRFDGKSGEGVTAKDLILHAIAQIGTRGAVGHIIEFAGEAIRDLSIEERFTLCNMAIEAGARAGLVAPDEKTVAYLQNRAYSPSGETWDAAAAYWLSLASDVDGTFDKTVVVDATAVGPVVTWGTTPEEVVSIHGRVPDPSKAATDKERAKMERALAYMGLSPNQKITDIEIDRVFIGSCTNARIEDLRAVASVIKGRKASVRATIVPGSMTVKLAAEAEGLDTIFEDAGFEWRNPGCSMCIGMNGDLLREEERCVSTSNRNFEGRQGPKSRTHLASPAIAAASAIAGKISLPSGLE